MAEVRRLEDVRYQQMVDLVLAKGAELSAMCTDSHVEEPAGLQEALAAIHSNDRNPGAAAELLAKLLHMLAEVQVGAVTPRDGHHRNQGNRRQGRLGLAVATTCACAAGPAHDPDAWCPCRC